MEGNRPGTRPYRLQMNSQPRDCLHPPDPAHPPRISLVHMLACVFDRTSHVRHAVHQNRPACANLGRQRSAGVDSRDEPSASSGDYFTNMI